MPALVQGDTDDGIDAPIRCTHSRLFFSLRSTSVLYLMGETPHRVRRYVSYFM